MGSAIAGLLANQNSSSSSLDEFNFGDIASTGVLGGGAAPSSGNTVQSAVQNAVGSTISTPFGDVPSALFGGQSSSGNTAAQSTTSGTLGSASTEPVASSYTPTTTLPDMTNRKDLSGISRRAFSRPVEQINNMFNGTEAVTAKGFSPMLQTTDKGIAETITPNGPDATNTKASDVNSRAYTTNKKGEKISRITGRTESEQRAANNKEKEKQANNPKLFEAYMSEREKRKAWEDKNPFSDKKYPGSDAFEAAKNSYKNSN